MRALSLLCIALILGSAFTEGDFPEEKDVMILTDKTFDQAVEKYEYLLVLFYAPWCGHCKKFHPEYEKAAKKLKEENLHLAKVDATAEKKLAERFQIQGYPTVKLIVKGQPIEYTGGRKEADVVSWMRKKTGPPAKELKSEADLESFIKGSEVAIVYFGDKKSNIEEFTKVAREIEDYPFGIAGDAALASAKKAKANSVVLFKKFDEKRNDLTEEITHKALTEFIAKYASPKVMPFDEKTAQIVFGKNQPALVIYADSKSSKYESYDKLLHNLSEKLGGKLKLVLTDIKDGMAARLAEYIGVKTADLPSVRIADTRIDLKKYNMEGEITEENILKFVKDWEDGKLKPHLKSADVPKDNNGDIFVVVGKSFQKEVIDNEKDVMLLFYAPWCGHCKAFHPKYEEAARKLKGSKNLVLAKIDATENEVESVSITGFPTIKFYPGKKKDKAPLDYNGDRSTDDVIKFIKEHASNEVVVSEDKADKKEDKKDDKKEDKKDAKKDEKKKTTDL